MQEMPKDTTIAEESQYEQYKPLINKMIKKRFGKFVIDKDAALALYKKFYEETHASTAKNSGANNQVKKFSAEDIESTVNTVLTKMLSPNYSAEECDQIIRAFEKFDFKPSQQNIADYTKWEHRYVNDDEKAIQRTLRSYFDKIRYAVIGQLSKSSDEETIKLIDNYLKEAKHFNVIIYKNDGDDLKMQMKATKAQELALDTMLNAILVRLGPDTGFSKKVGERLDEPDAKNLAFKILHSYKTQYESMLVYIDEHVKFLTNEIETAKEKKKDTSLLDAQIKGLAQLKKDMESQKERTISKGTEVTNVKQMVSYRSALIVAHNFLTETRKIKIGDKDTRTTYLKLIQKHHNKLQGFFNTIVDKLSKLLGKKESPALTVNQVRLWKKKSTVEKQRVLKAATKDHVKTLKNKFGF